jgi:hypothetical protein
MTSGVPTLGLIEKAALCQNRPRNCDGDEEATLP